MDKTTVTGGCSRIFFSGKRVLFSYEGKEALSTTGECILLSYLFFFIGTAAAFYLLSLFSSTTHSILQIIPKREMGSPWVIQSEMMDNSCCGCGGERLGLPPFALHSWEQKLRKAQLCLFFHGPPPLCRVRRSPATHRTSKWPACLSSL